MAKKNTKRNAPAPAPKRDSQRLPSSVKKNGKSVEVAPAPVEVAPAPAKKSAPVADGPKLSMRESMRKLETAHRLFQGRSQAEEFSKSQLKDVETWNFSISQAAVGLNSIDDDVNSYAEAYNKKRLTYAAARELANRLFVNLSIVADLFKSAK